MTLNKFILISLLLAAVCGIYSLIINNLSDNFKTYHWYFSLAFFLILFAALYYFKKTGSNGQTEISNVMTASLGRLLASAVAFMIYGYAFPFGKNAMLVHFVPHYFIFTGTELYFLLKLAKKNGR